MSLSAADARKRARLQEGVDELDEIFGTDSDDSDAGWGGAAVRVLEPRFDNVSNVEPPPLAPAHATLPAAYRPLFRAIRRCIKKHEVRALYRDVEMELGLTQAIEHSRFGNLQEWLETARGARLPVDFSYNKDCEIDFVWQVWPDNWVDESDTHRNAERRPPGTLCFQFGEKNLSTEIIKHTIELSTGFDRPVDAHRLAQKIGWTDQHFLSWVINEHNTHGLGMTWHWEGEQGFITIKSVEANVTKDLLSGIFKPLLALRSAPMHLHELERRLWDENPTVFLLTHTTDVASAIEKASLEHKTPLLVIRDGSQVIWVGPTR